MGKVKKTNHSEVRYLKGKIRELNKEVRNLRKQLSYHKKHEHFFVDNEEEIEDTEEVSEVETGIDCIHCGKGKYKEFEIMGRVFGTCPICEHREKLK